MTKDQLNEYILHYINEDKTGSAIMLTAPWGSGKTYYIQNNLIPFLKEKYNKKCVVVSVYGLKSLYELSKAIYLECRFRLLNKDSEKIEAGKLAVSTVFKGVASFFNVDLSKSEQDLKNLYESIDLSDKLIIIEDLERSNIDVNDVLGYVNNLVEQDGVKVLLVANEDEILEYEPLVIDDSEKKESIELLDKITNHKSREYTPSTKEYVKAKEKTISDTIFYEGDYSESIKNIIKRFESGYLSRFADEEFEDLCNFCFHNEITNLRTFIFACQKTVDILRIVNPNAEELDFIKTIFYSIILFSNRLKSGERLYWDGANVFSFSLASAQYPLFRFCYDYITLQSFDLQKVSKSKKELINYRLYDKDKSNDDPDLNTLYYWYFSSEKDVLTAINSITEKLKTVNCISFYEYGRIAAYLVTIKDLLACDIDEAKSLLINNLYNKGNEINPDYLFTSFFIDNISEDAKEEFAQLKTEMTDSLLAKKEPLFSFDYSPNSISKFREDTEKNCGKIIDSGEYISRLDIDKIIEMLKNCSAVEIYEFRKAFQSIYRFSNLRNYYQKDKEALLELSEKVNELQKSECFDKIQLKQIEWFNDNVKIALDKL